MSETQAMKELTEAEKIAEAVAEGYPDVDETCPNANCGIVFKNYHHFVRCDRKPCPMSDGKGTLLERLAAEWAIDKKNDEPEQKP